MQLISNPIKNATNLKSYKEFNSARWIFVLASYIKATQEMQLSSKIFLKTAVFLNLYSFFCIYNFYIVICCSFFSKNLEKCISNPVDLGNLFKKYERKFQM